MSDALVVYRHESEVGPYAEALEAARISFYLANVDDLPSLRDFQGLVLTGGTDVDPALYGESKQEETESSDRERDDAEMMLLDQALQVDMPILAICRGLQLMNVFHGGSLIQHLDVVQRHRQRNENRATPAHQIRIEPGSLLHSIAGRDDWQVNSRHHQAVKKVGEKLNVTAVDPADGTIEALERSDKAFVLAVQWHPENQALVDTGQLRIFQRFGESLGSRSKSI
jgi:putative glutamine amidotransferase